MKTGEAIKYAEVNGAVEFEKIKSQTKRFDKVRKPFGSKNMTGLYQVVISGLNAL